MTDPARTDPATEGPFEPDALVDALIAAVPEAARERDRIRVVRAPGRVNLIGEHTDYNLGFVLPAAIDLEIRIAYLPTDDRRVELTRLGDGGDPADRDGFDLDADRRPTGTWLDYVAGTAWALADAGHPRRGLRGVIASTLPTASGLSSSAAIELASAWAMLDDDAAATIDPMTLARLCQRAENVYVGVQCGLMDQFASACGVDGSAVLLDCRSLEWRPVALPDDVVLVVLHTGSPRSLNASEYNARRSQCEAAVAELARDDPSIASLRDVTLTALDRGAGPHGPGRLPPGAAYRHRERPRRGGHRGIRAPTTSRPSGGCSPPATPRCATTSRSSPRSWTRWSTSPPRCPASWRRG